MSDVKETVLPGIGIRHDFETRSGERVGVISHRGGRRDLLIYDHDDPDSCAYVMRLEEDDSHTLAELLGGTQITSSLSNLQQSISGLTIDWIPIKSGWTCTGSTIGQIEVRRLAKVSIVAVMRDGQTIPSPGADFRLEAGDTAVVIGTPDAIQDVFDLLQGV
jgi:TrkA domain protein